MTITYRKGRRCWWWGRWRDRRSGGREDRPSIATAAARELDRDRGNDQDRDLPVFPHLRVEGCTGCGRYLIDVDLGRDPAAVPEVDELVALPLDLYASEHSLSKITPNLMGF